MNVDILMYLVLYHHHIKGCCFLCDLCNHRELQMMLNFNLWLLQMKTSASGSPGSAGK